MDDTLIERARQIVKRFYPEMRPDYSGRRVDIALAARSEAFEEAAKIADRLAYEARVRRARGEKSFDASTTAGFVATALRAQAGEKPDG